MIKFINNNIDDINDVIVLTSNKLGLPEVIVEKDLWISVILQFLFTKSKNKSHFQFKGGTSLSKAYNIISRFSEDIDIVLSADAIGVNFNDMYTQNRNKREVLIDKYNLMAVNFYKESLIPELKKYFEAHIKHKLEINLNVEELAIYIKYPKISFTLL